MPRKGDNKKNKKEKKDKTAPVTREHTVHLAKYLHGLSFKKRAPRAIRELRKFAEKQMGTKDVRITVGLNQFLWSRGIRNVPRRVRIQLSRRRNEDQNAAEGAVYTLVSHVPVTSFADLTTQTVESQ